MAANIDLLVHDTFVVPGGVGAVVRVVSGRVPVGGRLTDVRLSDGSLARVDLVVNQIDSALGPVDSLGSGAVGQVRLIGAGANVIGRNCQIYGRGGQKPAPPAAQRDVSQPVAVDDNPWAYQPSAAPVGYGQPSYTGYAAIAPKPPSGLRTSLLVLFAVNLVLLVVKFFVYSHQRSVIHDLQTSPLSVSSSAVNATNNAVSAIFVVQLLLGLAVGVVFITWMYCAARTAEAVRPQAMRYSTGWAIGAWFVPFLNLVRPKRMMDDIWHASDRHSSTRGPVPFITLWWIGWLLTGSLGWTVGQVRTLNVTDPILQHAFLSAQHTFVTLAMVTCVFSFVTALLAMLVVHDITGRQETAVAAINPTAMPTPEPVVQA